MEKKVVLKKSIIDKMKEHPDYERGGWVYVHGKIGQSYNRKFVDTDYIIVDNGNEKALSYKILYPKSLSTCNVVKEHVETYMPINLSIDDSLFEWD